MSRTILIAGGGPISGRLARRLSRGTEDRIHVASLEASGLSGADLPAGAVDEVWHAGARLSPALRRPREAHERDLLATQALLSFVREREVGALHLISSVFGAGAGEAALREEPFDTQLSGGGPFERTVRAAESSAAVLCREKGVRLRVFRTSLLASAPAPEGGPLEEDWGLLSILCRFKDDIESKAPGYFQRRPLRLLGRADAGVPLIDADAAVELMVRVARGVESEGYFHVAAPPTPLGALCARIGEALGIKIELTTDASALSEVDDLLRRRLTAIMPSVERARPIDTSRTVAAAGPAPREPPSNPADPPAIQGFIASYRLGRAEAIARARRAPETMVKHTIDGGPDGPLTYVSLGEGPPVVLVNALGQGLFMWGWLIQGLSRGHRVIAWEPRGTFGKRAFTLADQVTDLKRIVAQEKSASIHLVCWCNGARTAFELLRQGGSVASMVLLNGSFKPFPGLESFYTTYEQTMGQLCETVAQKPRLAAILMKSLNAFLSGSVEQDPAGAADLAPVEVLKRTSDEIKRTLAAPFINPDSTRNYGCQINDLSAYDITGMVSELTVPTLLIAGQLDQIASADMSKAVAGRMRAADCVEIVGGTHYCMQENPELVLDLIEMFFAGRRDWEEAGAEITRHLGTA